MDEGRSPTRRRLLGLAVILFILFSWGIGWLQLVEPSGKPFLEDLYRVLMLFAINGDWVFAEDHGTSLRILAFVAPVFTVLTVIELVTRNLFHQLTLAWQLHRVRDHFVLIGLTDESFLVAKSLRRHPGDLRAVVIDADPPERLKAAVRRAGIPLIQGAATDLGTLLKARTTKAESVVSFLSDPADAIRLILSINGVAKQELNRAPSPASIVINAWIKLEDASLGLALAEYFKLPDVAEHVQPRFFGLDEVAVRRLIRFHAPDIYADAFGQERIHIAIYGFNGLAIEVIKQVVIQSTTKCTLNPRFTILDEDPAQTESALRAHIPKLMSLTDVDFRPLHSHETGISDDDYEVIPKQATMHVVCYANSRKATSTGLSLRKLSLVPPAGGAGLKRRLNAPIFVRLTRWRGIAQFLGSGVERFSEIEVSFNRDRDIPDGIFAFGMIDDLLLADDLDAFIPTIIDRPREEIAKHIHYSYLDDRETIAAEEGSTATERRKAESDWPRLAPEYRESCRLGADHIWTKARVIRARIVRRSQHSERGRQTDSFEVSNAEQRELAVIEHRRWMNERILSGWSYHPKRVDFAHTHNLLRPWEELPQADAHIDVAMIERFQAGIRSIGLEMRRELVIGVVGHRNLTDHRMNTGTVRGSLRSTIQRLLDENRGKTPVILTALAEGADVIAAEIAIEMDIPFIAVLPLPFETYRQDFELHGAREAPGVEPLKKFLSLVGRAERYLEMPLKFGDLITVSLTTGTRDFPEERNQQYALAAAYIVERADELIAVWDRQPAKGVGGTADTVHWREKGKIPQEFATRPVFYDRPAMKAPIILTPDQEAA